MTASSTDPGHVLILGGTSEIALAIAAALARRGHGLTLAGRDADALQREAADLEIRHGVSVTTASFDALELATHPAFWQSLNPAPAGVVCAVGLLGDHGVARTDFNHARQILDTNLVGCISVLDQAALAFEQRGEGFIIGISSVAGDRGRASNYYYGAAKAGFTAYLSGLRNHFASTASRVRVITVKPGFVATRMTADHDTPALLTAQPEQTARDVLRALDGRRDVIYSRWYWRWIMLIIRLLPEPVFKRTRL